jgi:hypothetical protein
MSVNPIADNFLAFASTRMHLSQQEISRCLDRLSNEQMWRRGGDYENSIANLLLHLTGNLRQWILYGIDNQQDIRQRDQEFCLIPSVDAAEARTLFNATLEESARVIASLDRSVFSPS